jgi:hypothetical protein
VSAWASSSHVAGKKQAPLGYPKGACFLSKYGQICGQKILKTYENFIHITK